MDCSCRVCGGPPGALFTAREMMFGSRERFEYFECSSCGCVQIAAVPTDLGRHYANNYYSMGDLPVRRSRRERLADAWAYGRRGGPLAALHYALRPHHQLRLIFELGVRREDRILDVGCGRGHRVLRLQRAGLADVLGCDPFLPEDVWMDGRLVARRASIDGVDGPFRLIMFNHSLEHMSDHHAVLERVRRILSDDGLVLVRIPTVSSDAWRIYREDWVQLDAPRHLVLHSRESLRRLAAAHGFEVARIEDDSEAFQFWGSELYRRDVPLCDPATGALRGPPRRTRSLERRAARLNAAGRGDQFCAILAPAGRERLVTVREPYRS